METLNQHSWQVLQRQSPAAIFVMLLRAAISIIKIFWPVVVGLFIKVNKSANNDSFGYYVQWSVIIFSVLAVLYAVIEYFYYRFQVTNNHFIIKSGWLEKKNISIPLANIQDVHLQQSIWQRLFSVTSLKIDSPGTNQNEVSLDAITMAKAVELRMLLLSSISNHTNQETEIKINPLNEARGWKLEIADLLKLSLTANHIQAFFIILFFGLGIMDDLQRLFNFNGLDAIESASIKAARGQTILAVIMFMGFVAVISVLVSAMRTINRFYNFTITPIKKGWRIAHGLLKYQQRLIPYRKVQLLSWHANWLRRKIGFWVVDIKIIGSDSIRKQEQLQIITTQLEQVYALVPSYQQTPVAQPGEGAGINAAYHKRKLLIIILPITTALFISAAYWLQWHSCWILLLGIIYYIHVVIYARNFRWLAHAEGLQLFEGVWGRKITLLKWQKVQQVCFTQSIYQQKNNLASLQFKTAGGSVSIPYLDAVVAKELVNKVLYIIEAREINWQ